MKKNKQDEQNEHDPNASKEHYLEGAPEFQDTLDDVLDELESRSAYYRRKIRARAAEIHRQAEWKLRTAPDKNTAPVPAAPTTPKAPSTTPSKPRSDHGKPPTSAPAGKSYYWADPSTSNKGGGHE